MGLAVEQLALRDVVVPAELRRAAAELATTRAQGLATLERARSEVAAMRALANAARLAEQQPALMRLRTLQAVEAGGATVVLQTSCGPGQRAGLPTICGCPACCSTPHLCASARRSGGCGSGCRCRTSAVS